MTQHRQRFNAQRLSLIKPYTGRMLLGLIFMLLTIALQLSFPQALSYFIDNAASNFNTGWLIGATGMMFLALTLYCISSALRYYFFESAGSMLVTDLRRKLFGSIIHQEIGFFDSNNSAELNSRLSADVEVLRSTLSMELAIAIRSVLVFIGGVALLLTTSVALTFLIALVVPASLFLSRWLGGKARDLSRKMQESMANVLQISQENITNIRLVHTFNQQDNVAQTYHSATAETLDIVLANTRLFGFFQASSTFVSFSTLLIILVFGAHLMAQQAITVGELASFIMYGFMVTSSSNAITGVWGSWMRSVGATERVFELINRRDSSGSQTDTNANASTINDSDNGNNAHIAFNSVSFHYPARPEHKALDTVSFAVNRGEKVALVGTSGAGKSTIAALLLGFYQPTSGKISINRLSLDNLSASTLRSNVSVVEQEPSLFAGSIADNIAFAVPERTVTTAEIENVAKSAHAHEFISAFPNGYNTIVGEQGVQLSGGQKQRIAIARALLRNPQILILDEATSALDNESEKLVQEALDTLMQNRTTMMIAHRFSTIAKADRILVMQAGKIVEQGSPKALQHSNGVFVQLMGQSLTDTDLTSAD